MSHTKATPPPQINLYNRFFEYARVVVTVVVTEEGVYLKDNVPDTYGGAELELDMVWAVFMINAKAEMSLWELAPDYPMDKDKKKGGPIMRDKVKIREKVGDSAVPVEQRLVINENLDEDRKIQGSAAFAKFKEDLAEQPAQPQS